MSDLLLKFVGQGYKEQLSTSYLGWRDGWMDRQTTVAKVVDKWLLPSCPVDWAWLADVGLCCTQLLQPPFFHLPTKPNLQCHWGWWSLRDTAPISSCSCDPRLVRWKGKWEQVTLSFGPVQKQLFHPGNHLSAIQYCWNLSVYVVDQPSCKQ